MSDVSRGSGWWQASDGKWYRPEQHPNYLPPPPSQVIAAPYPGPPSYAPPQRSDTNGLAIASLVLSILWLVGLGSLLAIIFALVAERQIRRSAGQQGGAGLAIAGLVIGIIGLLGTALITAGLLVSSTAVITSTAEGVAVGSCQADTRSVQTALEAYKAQVGSFPTVPAPWSAANYRNNFSPLTVANGNNGPYLRVAPGTVNYVVEYDSHGDVWVEPSGTYDSGYRASQDLNTNSNACSVALP
jgi:hypothetical protein